MKTTNKKRKPKCPKNMKPVRNFEDYLINESGDIYSTYKNKYMRPWPDSKGYPQVDLHKDGKRHNRKVHRLVAETFLPNPLNLPEINHKDENKNNPRLDNLEWCTTKYNCNYGTRMDRLTKSLRSSTNKYRRAVVQLDKNFNVIKEYDSACRAAEETGFSQGNIVAVLRNRRPTVHGYIFMYKEDYLDEISRH